MPTSLFKKKDYLIISIICFFLGIFLVSQFHSSKEVKKISQPENSETLALEVSKLTKTNSDLRQEVKTLTSTLDSYKDTSESGKKLYEKYLSDKAQYDIIIGNAPKTGQGISVMVTGTLNTAQIVDLINAIKNIGSSMISINGKRLVVNTDLSQFAGKSDYKIDVLGNSKLLDSAIKRKGGILEQISTKDLKIDVISSDEIVMPKGETTDFVFAKIVTN
ncbi:MAG: DUF881 domain-containing protein [Candidatus Berkelbacteria bacterium]